MDCQNKHDEIAKKLQEHEEWFTIEMLCTMFNLNVQNAHSVVKRIETSGQYNMEIKKEKGKKYFKILADGNYTYSQKLTRLALFGVPIS